MLGVNKLNEINELINNLLQEHTGGSAFFDNLDEAVRNNKEDILELLYKKVSKYAYINSINYIVVSGAFGKIFNTFYSEQDRNN